jgi:hypothetical protein
MMKAFAECSDEAEQSALTDKRGAWGNECLRFASLRILK